MELWRLFMLVHYRKVSTLAWYQAGQALTASPKGMTLEATTAVTNADDRTVYAKFSVAQGSSCKMTNKEGYEYYLNAANRLYRKATQPEKALGEQYGSATLVAVSFWNDEACSTSQITASAELALISTPANKAINVTITGGSRVRVAKNAPSALGAPFYATDGTEGDHGFGSTLGNAITFTGITITAGVVSSAWTPSTAFYYAFNGTGTTLKTDTELASSVGTVIEDASWLDGDGVAVVKGNLVVTAETVNA